MRAIYRAPMKFNQGPPVLQMYINDGETNCFIGINNFFSCLAPQVESNAICDLQFYSKEGQHLFSYQQTLKHFGAESINIRKLFQEKNIVSPYGLILLQITPKYPRRKVYKTLGLTAAHFFIFYQDVNGSVAHIHPSSVADPNNKPAASFVSNQIITTDGLESVVLYQCNPTPNAHTLSHSLLDSKTNTPLISKSMTLAPYATSKAVLHMTELTAVPDQILLHIDVLPSSNSKPMLRRIYKNGLFSMSHS